MVRHDGTILSIETVSIEELEAALLRLADEDEVGEVVVGDGTGGDEVLAEARRILPRLRFVVVDERFTTLEARDLYLELHPRRWWGWLLPRFLLVPDEGLDGYAAAVLGRRYIRERRGDGA